MTKLNLATRTQVAAWALERRLDGPGLLGGASVTAP